MIKGGDRRKLFKKGRTRVKQVPGLDGPRKPVVKNRSQSAPIPLPGVSTQKREGTLKGSSPKNTGGKGGTWWHHSATALLKEKGGGAGKKDSRGGAFRSTGGPWGEKSKLEGQFKLHQGGVGFEKKKKKGVIKRKGEGIRNAGKGKPWLKSGQIFFGRKKKKRKARKKKKKVDVGKGARQRKKKVTQLTTPIGLRK